MGTYSSAFKTEYYSYKNGGQCFQCGEFFRKAYGCCVDHKGKKSYGLDESKVPSKAVATYRS